MTRQIASSDQVLAASDDPVGTASDRPAPAAASTESTVDLLVKSVPVRKARNRWNFPVAVAVGVIALIALVALITPKTDLRPTADAPARQQLLGVWLITGIRADNVDVPLLPKKPLHITFGEHVFDAENTCLGGAATGWRLDGDRLVLDTYTTAMVTCPEALTNPNATVIDSGIGALSGATLDLSAERETLTFSGRSTMGVDYVVTAIRTDKPVPSAMNAVPPSMSGISEDGQEHIVATTTTPVSG